MSNSEELLNKGVFDIRAVLSERLYPEDTVKFYVDEALGYQVERLENRVETLQNQLRIANLGEDDKLKAKAEKAVNDAERLLAKTHQAATPYVATIRSISRRAKHDLQSKALHAFPIKRDIFGNDDPQNEFDRTHYIEQLIWASHIRSIQSPDGAVQKFSGLDDLEAIEYILDNIPESAHRTIDAAIGKLVDDGNQFEFAVQDEDFSSES